MIGWNRVARAVLAVGAPLVSLVSAGSAPADEPAPSFVAHKPRVTDLDDKTEGTYPTGVPLLGYDSNTGFGLGAGAYLYFDGVRRDPLFAYTPYRHRFFVQAYATTGGYQQHALSYDGVYLADTPLRLRVATTFERNTNANYFGVGEATLGRLCFAGHCYDRASDAEDAASRSIGGVEASPKYFHYDVIRPAVSATLAVDLLGGWLRAQYGFVMEHVSIATYDGTTVDATDANGASFRAIEGPTKLGSDCASHAVLGCEGGWNNRLFAGVAFDTRDFEPDPDAGVFLGLSGEWSARAFASATDYVRLTASARFYWSPIPRLADLVLAARLAYSMSGGDVPFYAMHTLLMTDRNQEGLGGENTLRGFRQDRFVGKVAALGNLEVRWTFAKFHLAKQFFSAQVAPFFDVGRVFDEVTFAFDHFQPDGGAGVHLAWNQSTILRFDAGFSREDYGLFLDFDMPY